MPEALRRLALRARGWPAALRDVAAASLALLSLSLGETLALLLPLPAEVLFALPGVMLAWWALGGTSALFGLLLAALAISLLAAARPKGLPDITEREALALLGMALAMVTIGLAARAWAKGRERRAAKLMDACAADALRRIAAAEARLGRAEAAAAAARVALGAAQADLQRARAGGARAEAAWPGDAGLEEARRREGGV